MSTHNKPEKGDQLQNKHNIEGRIYDAMRALGWMIPTTEEDVEEAELMLSKEEPPLPEELQDPYQTLDGMDSDCLPFDPAPVAVDAEVEENLARAAREGGVIRPEIERRMRADRQAAEQTTP
jgi:hypothetical protein